MYATNEWDPLKKVIVGSATEAQIPNMDMSLRLVNYADVEDTREISIGRYPEQVVSEANEDLETFCDFLRGESVEVLRPHIVKPTRYYDYCPRDVVFVHGEHAIATPMPIHARHTDHENLKHHIPDMYVRKPALRYTDLNSECVGNPNVLALQNRMPMFDAANIIRANEDILYLVSNSGNHIGADWLQKWTGLNVQKLTGVYSYMHIDSTICFLREGLMLINPERVKDVSALPKPFCDWDYIVCPEPTPIGHYPGYRNSSDWIGMNLFNVNPHLVAVEENQHNLRAELEKHAIECAMLPMRQAVSLGGCFHCVTLDLERQS